MPSPMLSLFSHRFRRLLSLFSWSLVVFSVVGCVGPIRGGWSIGLLLLAFLGIASLFSTQTACEVSVPLGEKKGDGLLPDASTDKESGRWEPCCQNGKISTCFCPANAACNYGWYTDCGNGVCIGNTNASCSGEKLPDSPPDTIKPDTAKPEEPPKEEAGTWETCCQSGKISSCFCPAGAACNYGWFHDCGNQTCVLRGDTCPNELPPDTIKPDTIKPDTIKPDTIKPDAIKPEEPPKEVVPEEKFPEPQGTWESCCQNGKVSSCFCPAGMACNYGWYKDCGGGTCLPDPTATCPKEVVPEPPPPERQGTWESCCQNGKVSSCFCPAGMACNYGWYTDCGNQVCVSPGQTCP